MNASQLLEKHVRDLLPEVSMQEIYEGFEENGVINASTCNEFFRHLYEMDIKELEKYAYETKNTKEGEQVAFALINRVYGAKKYEGVAYITKAIIAFGIGVGLYYVFK